MQTVNSNIYDFTIITISQLHIYLQFYNYDSTTTYIQWKLSYLT